MEKAKVMIIDAGARGHALALKYLESSHVGEVILAPGNDGAAGDRINAPFLLRNQKIRRDPSVSLDKLSTMIDSAARLEPDLIDVAQDNALALGAVDFLIKNGNNAFGPTKSAARIEWNKSWARQFMKRHDIPAPEWKAFDIDDVVKAADFARALFNRYETVFLKASGLYAGKGVVPATKNTLHQAIKKIQEIGEAARTFLVEQGMEGEEFSFYALVDGKNFHVFKSAQDNKRVYNGDKGSNTGGMGCNSPALVTKGLEERIAREIIAPVVRGLAQEGMPYTGILYLGGIVERDGTVRVVEFNSRWGDPECHVVLPGIKNDYYELVNSALRRELDKAKIREDTLTRVCVIGASPGYPREYEKGKRIFIDERRMPVLRDGVHLLSAGVAEKDGELYTAGGRVLSVVASGKNAVEARTKALQGMAAITVEGGLHYRTDIAERDVRRLISNGYNGS